MSRLTFSCWLRVCGGGLSQNEYFGRVTGLEEWGQRGSEGEIRLHVLVCV